MSVDKKILDEVEKGLSLNHTSGVVVIKKEGLRERTDELVAGVEDYLRNKGYDTLPIKGSEEYHLVYILNPF